MSIDFYTWSGIEGEVMEEGLNVGGSTAYRLLTCVGLVPGTWDQQQWPLGDFAIRLDDAMKNWGPDSPGYPDAQYVWDYGRTPGYVLYWLQQLAEVVERGRKLGHQFMVWV